MIPSVTGWAWRTPLGADVNTACDRLLAGERAALLNPHGPSYTCQWIAPIPDPPASSRNRRFVNPIALHAIEVAAEAFAMAEAAPSDRLGVYAGIGGLRAGLAELMPAMSDQRADADGAWQRGFRSLHPLWMLRYLSNNAHGIIAAELGARGEGVTFGGPIAGAQALAAACRALAAGAIDRALVVAYDTMLAPEMLVELGQHGADKTAGGARSQRPYSERASGFVPGEAAVAVMIDRDDQRGLALVRSSCASGPSAGEPTADLLARAAVPLVTPGMIIDGVGRGSLDADAAERRALGRLVEADSPLTSVAAAMGRVGAAMPLVQLVAMASCLRRGVLPPIAGEGELRNGPLDPVGELRQAKLTTALCLATGTPGAASAIRVEVAV